MKLACFDLEGVLVPEIWIAFADRVGLPELRRTTRDEPDYDRLMHYRMEILDRNGLGMREIEEVLGGVEPLPGAVEFLDRLRERMQCVIISDTFETFGRPIMRKLKWPMLMCNSLEADANGKIVGYHLRCNQTKLTTVKAFQSCGYETIAVGDSFNDLPMIRASKAGFLFRTTDAIRAANPDLRALTTYDELFDAIIGV